jgi:hypothetical protein
MMAKRKILKAKMPAPASVPCFTRVMAKKIWSGLIITAYLSRGAQNRARAIAIAAKEKETLLSSGSGRQRLDKPLRKARHCTLDRLSNFVAPFDGARRKLAAGNLKSR